MATHFVLKLDRVEEEPQDHVPRLTDGKWPERTFLQQRLDFLLFTQGHKVLSKGQ